MGSDSRLGLAKLMIVFIMRLRHKSMFFVVLIVGAPTMALAQIPNPLDWIFPRDQRQQQGNGTSSQGNERHCSMQQQQNSYINQCGELIRGWQDAPVGGG